MIDGTARLPPQRAATALQGWLLVSCGWVKLLKYVG